MSIMILGALGLLLCVVTVAVYWLRSDRAPLPPHWEDFE